MYSDERKEVLLWFIAAIAALNLNRILLSVKSAALKPSLHGLRTRTHIVERIP